MHNGSQMRLVHFLIQVCSLFVNHSTVRPSFSKWKDSIFHAGKNNSQKQLKSHSPYPDQDRDLIVSTL